jgi:hypothetical protein
MDSSEVENLNPGNKARFVIYLVYYVLKVKSSSVARYMLDQPKVFQIKKNVFQN